MVRMNVWPEMSLDLVPRSSDWMLLQRLVIIISYINILNYEFI